MTAPWQQSRYTNPDSSRCISLVLLTIVGAPSILMYLPCFCPFVVVVCCVCGMTAQMPFVVGSKLVTPQQHMQEHKGEVQPYPCAPATRCAARC